MSSNSVLRLSSLSFVSAYLCGVMRTCAGIFATSAMIAGCVMPNVDAREEEDLAEEEAALCAAPGAPVAFGSPQVRFQNVYPQSVQAAFAIPGDFNGDGLLDAVFVADGDKQRLVHMAGNGSGISLAHVSEIGVPLSLYNPQGGTALDYDGDGDLDIAYVTQGGTSLVIALNDGLGSFSVGPIQFIPSTYGMKRAAAGDFNGDGRPDIAITSTVTRVVRIVLNTPSGLSLLPAISTGNASPLDITAADLNQDGKVDLVAGLSFAPQPLFILQGNGDGTFAQVAAPLPKNQGINGAYSLGLVLADFDADGRSDVAYVESNTRAVHVFRNNSTTGVSFANEVDSGSGPYVLGTDSLSDIFMAAGDFDLDGQQDLAIIGKVFTVGSRLHLLRNSTSTGGLLSFASSTGPWLVNSNGKTSTTPRGFVAGPFNVSSCGSRPDIVFSSNNDTAADWSVQYIPNTTE